MTVKINGIKEKIEAARAEKQAMKDAHDKVPILPIVPNNFLALQRVERPERA